jgi:polygalacturonase
MSSYSVLDLRALGAVGDGVALETPVFARACEAAEAAGGGTILVPPGQYRTGSIRLPDCTTLRLAPGAVIRGSQNPADYPMSPQPWEGTICKSHDPLIGARDAHDVAVVGEGVIDGCGQPWWQAVREGRSKSRPRLLGFERCRRVRIEGVTLTNSPSWTVHPFECADVLVRGITIQNPSDSPNTDGINPDSCSDVRISDCLINAGDDCITLKSGASEDGTGSFKPCERISITNCQLAQGHGGIVIGSEMSGGVRDVTVANCVLRGTDRGIRIKTRRGRGGVVENLTVTNLVMRDVGCPLVINMYYRYTNLRPELRDWAASLEPQAVTNATPIIRRIRITGLTAIGVGGPCLAFCYGLPESPIRALALSDCELEHATEPDPAMRGPAMMLIKENSDYATGGLFATHVDGLRLVNSTLSPRSGPVVELDRVAGYEGPAFQRR